ncbi:MAG TPA: hypothetical protein VHQ87_06335, partial [Rhizobacter sp.]|nr:hypothetical protein [Rhizobacter sp.]
MHTDQALRRTLIQTLCSLAFGLGLSATAQAQQEVKIGVIYPLTGAAASVGGELKNALEMAADIINNGSKNTPDLPFSAGG